MGAICVVSAGFFGELSMCIGSSFGPKGSVKILVDFWSSGKSGLEESKETDLHLSLTLRSLLRCCPNGLNLSCCPNGLNK